MPGATEAPRPRAAAKLFLFLLSDKKLITVVIYQKIIDKRESLVAKAADSRPDYSLTFGLHRFQHDFNLKPDGIAEPGGETERELNRVAGPLMGQHLERMRQRWFNNGQPKDGARPVPADKSLSGADLLYQRRRASNAFREAVIAR